MTSVKYVLNDIHSFSFCTRWCYHEASERQVQAEGGGDADHLSIQSRATRSQGQKNVKCTYCNKHVKLKRALVILLEC